MTHSTLAIKIDALLPQTQCGLCGHGGCMPYAKAIAEQGESINRCPPGGERVLNNLASLLQQSPMPLLNPAKPTQIAFIREEECIGCMKCITACPVDAIVGAAKLMHTVISDACTGCELCVAPCPVDCIDMLTTAAPATEAAFYQQADMARQRFYRHNERLAQLALDSQKQHADVIKPNKMLTKKDDPLAARKDFIAAAIARAKLKKGP